MVIRFSFILCVAMLTLPASAQEFHWDMADEQSATSLSGEASLLFAKLVKERSGGRIQITVHSGGSLGFGSEQHWDLVADGAIALANTPPHHLGGYAPLLEIGSLPFLTANTAQARILFEVAKPAYDELLRKNNQILVSVGPWPPSGFWSRKPIRTVSDIQRWKLRVFDTNGQITLAAAGALPLPLSWGSVAPALSTGSIDGVLTSAQAGVASRLWEHVGYFTEINYALPLNMIHMNLDVWNALPADLQNVVLQVGKEVTDAGFAKVEAQVAIDYAKMRANGMTVIEDPAPALIEHLERSAAASYHRWLGKMGPLGVELLTEYRRRAARLARP